MKKNKLVYGWGINDSDTPVYKYKKVDGYWKVVSKCPIYVDWQSVLQRCFDNKFKTKYPTYKDCTVCEEWRYFSNFRNWVLNIQPNKNWENCVLDKDILLYGNKEYSPDTCVYVEDSLNLFFNINSAKRGGNLIGASYHKVVNKYGSKCQDPFNGIVHLGYFHTELEAHKAWQAKKHEYACQLADLQQDPRVANALKERYAPDRDWTNK